MKKGTFTNMRTKKTVPLKWAGHWGAAGYVGVLIPKNRAPKMPIEKSTLYHVKFDRVDKFMDHHIDGYVEFVRIVAEEFPGIKFPNERRYSRKIKVTNMCFNYVSNLGACDEKFWDPKRKREVVQI